MKTGTIYGLICPISKHVVYVGQTIKPLHKRLLGHRYKAKRTNRSLYNTWIRELRKRKLLHKIEIVAIEENVSQSNLKKRELYHIYQCYLSNAHTCVNTSGTPPRLYKDTENGKELIVFDHAKAINRIERGVVISEYQN